MLNVSQCEVTETNSRFVATVYNPRSQEQTTYIRLPVTNGIFTVIDPDGSELVTQLIPLSDAALQSVKNERANSLATHELVFQAAKLPPIGHKSFYIQKSATADESKFHHRNDAKRSFNQLTKVWKAKAGEMVSITNEKVTAVFDSNGLMSDVIVDGVNVKVSQNLMWYPGQRQGNTGSGDLDRPSGAYIFRPNGTEAFAISDVATSVTVYQGALVQEVHQQFSDWASQIVRIYKGQTDIEIEWTIGSIPVDDGVPKEIINRVVTGIPSQERFYSDSNGRQTLMRQRDFRPTWTYKVVEPVSGNYYPINSHIYLTDREQENANIVLALVNDRSQGGTSLRDGELELMVHRRLLDDDHKGVGEALNEHEQEPDLPIKGPGLPVRGTHYLLIDPNLQNRHPMSLIRPLAQNVMMKPWVSFAVTDFTYTKWKNSFLMKKSGLTKPLQDNLHILTLEPFGDATHLMRLEHVYDAKEHPALSQPINVALDVYQNNYFYCA
jgi:lysosomal alpha-mannosidase